MNTIDINSDLGESFGQWHMGDDARMLTVVSSANIACGFHAGDPAGMRATLKAAAANQVCCGAHVGYPDIQGFGRREMNMADDDLTASVIYQIGALAGLARAAGTRVSYVKPHGALYNTIAHDRRQGMAVINAIKDYNASLPLVVLAGSPLAQLAREQGLQVVAGSLCRPGLPSGRYASFTPGSRCCVARYTGHCQPYGATGARRRCSVS